MTERQSHHEVVRRAAEPLQPQTADDVAFLITASELRHRKRKRRRKHDLPGRSETVPRLVEIGLKAK